MCNSLPHKFQELCGEEGMGQVGYGYELGDPCSDAISLFWRKSTRRHWTGVLFCSNRISHLSSSPASDRCRSSLVGVELFEGQALGYGEEWIEKERKKEFFFWVFICYSTFNSAIVPAFGSLICVFSLICYSVFSNKFSVLAK